MYRVLIVDDEPSVIEDLKRNVNWKALGIRHIIRAESVQEALSLYEMYTPDIVISDIEMVGRSGLDLLAAIQERRNSCRFLFLTCHPEFEYMRRAMQLGSCDYLLKPVDYAELTAVLQKLIRKLNESIPGDTPAEGIPLKGEHDLVAKARQYIADHLVEKIRIADIAAHVGCSESTLTRAFKSETDWGIVEYITMQRVSRAGQLLKNTDWNIQLISGMCGYDDSAYFSRVFKKITGLSPSEYQHSSSERGSES